jgi:hypothetical protein
LNKIFIEVFYVCRVRMSYIRKVLHRKEVYTV